MKTDQQKGNAYVILDSDALSFCKDLSIQLYNRVTEVAQDYDKHLKRHWVKRVYNNFKKEQIENHYEEAFKRFSPYNIERFKLIHFKKAAWIDLPILETLFEWIYKKSGDSFKIISQAELLKDSRTKPVEGTAKLYQLLFESFNDLGKGLYNAFLTNELQRMWRESPASFSESYLQMKQALSEMVLFADGKKSKYTSFDFIFRLDDILLAFQASKNQTSENHTALKQLLIMFKKIQLKIASQHIICKNDSSKKELFKDVQKLCFILEASRIKELMKEKFHTNPILDQIKSLGISSVERSDQNLYLNKNDYRLEWKGTKSEFIELAKALIETNSIKGPQHKAIEALSGVFQLEVPNSKRLLQAVISRNPGGETLFIDKLKKAILNHRKSLRKDPFAENEPD